MEQQSYQCLECGLHYADEETANACAAFCKEHSACNIDITKHSLEATTAGE